MDGSDSSRGRRVRTVVPALALAALVVTAGCQGVSVGERLGEGVDDVVGTTETDWRNETMVVALDSPGDRSFAGPTRSALTWWEQNGERYLGREVAFELDPDAEDPDIVVHFVPNLSVCPESTDAAGCAPRIPPGRVMERPVDVEIKTGFSPESTDLVIRHEIGHVLGFRHGEGPERIMARESHLASVSKPDATERAFPWKSRTLSVYVDVSGAEDPERARTQVGHALDYYARGADGTVPSNVTFERTDERSAADVVILARSSVDCQSGDGSCGSRSGIDPDRDGAMEWYTNTTITFAGLDADATGWHVGYWLGYAMGFDDPGDYPPPLRDASAEERRSDWWS